MSLDVAWSELTLSEMIAQATVPEGKPPLWHSWGDAGAELEVCIFLDALIRAAKPRAVWESGGGRSSLFLANAVANGPDAFAAGLRLLVFEPDARWHSEVTEMLADLEYAAVLRQPIPWPVDRDATILDLRDASPLPSPSASPDMVILDSDPHLREAEIAEWLKANVLLAVHDARDYERLLRGKGGFTLHTPRGLWIRDQRKRPAQ